MPGLRMLPGLRENEEPSEHVVHCEGETFRAEGHVAVPDEQ